MGIDYISYIVIGWELNGEVRKNILEKYEDELIDNGEVDISDNWKIRWYSPYYDCDYSERKIFIEYGKYPDRIMHWTENNNCIKLNKVNELISQEEYEILKLFLDENNFVLRIEDISLYSVLNVY
jgi:hypothetical protein